MKLAEILFLFVFCKNKRNGTALFRTLHHRTRGTPQRLWLWDPKQKEADATSFPKAARPNETSRLSLCVMLKWAIKALLKLYCVVWFLCSSFYGWVSCCRLHVNKQQNKLIMPTTILMRVLAADLAEGFSVQRRFRWDEIFLFFLFLFLTHLSMLWNMRWWAAHIDIIYLNFYQWNRKTKYVFSSFVGFKHFSMSNNVGVVVWHGKLMLTFGSVVPNCHFALIGGGDSWIFFFWTATSFSFSATFLILLQRDMTFYYYA